MCFISRGEILYFPRRDVSRPIQVRDTPCSEDESWNEDEPATSQGSWLCEAIVWTPWMHRGTAKSHMQTELLQLNPVPFRTTVLEHPVHAAFSKHYALFYVEQLNQRPEEISDLEESLVTRQDMINMTEELGLMSDELPIVKGLHSATTKVQETLGGASEKIGGVLTRLGGASSSQTSIGSK